MANPPAATAPAGRAEYRALFAAAGERLELFPEEQQRQLRVWLLWADLANQLFTDDPFEFSKVTGKVRQEIEGLPEVTAEDEAEERASSAGSASVLSSAAGEKEIRPGIDLASAATDELQPPGLSSEGTTMAQTAIDMLVKHAHDHAARFTAVQRAAVLKMYLASKEQQLARKHGGRGLAGKLDVTSFERLQGQYANEKISIRKAVGASGGRTTTTWLG
eukprot:SM000036S13247  [mRNA]  locus=s36:101788:103399:+ [translate_table: standard]